jgi:hypothetical protein
LTFPAVAPQAPIDETSSMSRQAHAQGSIDGRPWESLKHGDESAKCYAAFVPRYRGRNCTLSSDAASGIHEPPSGGPHIRGASATPIAALSGSQHKAPGFAGGYLLIQRAVASPHRGAETILPPIKQGEWMPVARPGSLIIGDSKSGRGGAVTSWTEPGEPLSRLPVAKLVVTDPCARPQQDPVGALDGGCALAVRPMAAVCLGVLSTGSRYWKQV